MICAEKVLDFDIVSQPLSLWLDEIVTDRANGGIGCVLACANPHSLVTAKRDPPFFKALKAADILIPDGAGIVAASWILGGSIRRRITGSDVFRELSRRLNQETGWRYFFLGSTPQNLDRIQRKFRSEYPNITIAGAYSPPFKSEFTEADSQAMIDAVNRAQPHVLWVGMTAPKQEKWIHRHRSRLNVNLIAAVGAVFDFYVGTVKRSPQWFQDHGLEWLPRLLQQPGRLYHRMLISAPLFMLEVVKQRQRTRSR